MKLKIRARKLTSTSDSKSSTRSSLTQVGNEKDFWEQKVGYTLQPTVYDSNLQWSTKISEYASVFGGGEEGTRKSPNKLKAQKTFFRDFSLFGDFRVPSSLPASLD